MNLELEVDGRRREFNPGRKYTVGRGSASDVVITDPDANVSRHHLDLRFKDGSWVAEDRSSGGSYVDGQRFETVNLQDGMSIRLGPPGSPTVLVRLPEADNGKQNGGHAGPPVLHPENDIGAAGTVALNDEALQLELDDSHYTFLPSQRVVVGRGTSCDVTTQDRLVSGEHCVFEHDGSSWTLKDLDSSRGTFIDGKKIKGKRKIAGAFSAKLGAVSYTHLTLPTIYSV